MGKAAIAPEGQTVTYTGTLLAEAQVRFTIIDAEGHMAPALCMSVALDAPAGAVLQLEQVFPDADRCRWAALRHRAGTRVTVVAPLCSLRLNARFVEHIHIHKD